MRKTSKIKRFLSLLLTLCMVLGMVNVPVAHAADSGENIIYFNPTGGSADWSVSNAWFAVYFFGSSGNTWVKATDSDGNGVYEVPVPDGYENVIFVRKDPANTALSWDSVWNQTVDLTIADSKNLFTIENWDNGEGKSTGNWSPYWR